MALNRFDAGIVTRTKGQNVIARAAYNARECLTDDRTAEQKDYREKGGLEWSGIFAPKGAPEWVQDRQALWNAVEEREDRSTRPDQAQLARDFKLSIPHELDQEQRKRLVTDFAREMSRKGMVIDVAIHAPDEHNHKKNYHVHMLLTLREIDHEGFGNKVRAWNKVEELEKWKERWSELGARYLERAGFDKEAERYRVGHKTLKEQRKFAIARGDREYADILDREPTIPVGPAGKAMERERGIVTPRARRLAKIVARNEAKAKDRIMGKDRPAPAPAIIKSLPGKFAGLSHTVSDAIDSLFNPHMTTDRKIQAEESRLDREHDANETARRRQAELERDRD